MTTLAQLGGPGTGAPAAAEASAAGPAEAGASGLGAATELAFGWIDAVADALPEGWGWWAGAAAVLGLWTLGAHNRVTGLKAAILSAWSQVDALLAARSAAVAALLEATAAPLADEAAAHQAVAQAQAQVQAAADVLRRAPVAADPAQELAKADAVLGAVLVRLVALAEQRPGLAADPAVAQPLQVLKDVPPRLGFAREAFNSAGVAYNAATQQFPTRLLGGLLRFQRAGRL